MHTPQIKIEITLNYVIQAARVNINCSSDSELVSDNSFKSDTFNVSAIFIMSNKLRRRVCIKLATETFEIIKKTFEDEVMNRFKTFEWHIRFIEGREEINDDSYWTTFNIKKCGNGGKCTKNYSIRSTSDNKRTF